MCMLATSKHLSLYLHDILIKSQQAGILQSSTKTTHLSHSSSVFPPPDILKDAVDVRFLRDLLVVLLCGEACAGWCEVV